MIREKKERNVIILLLCTAILIMSVGFAVLSSELRVVGTASVKTSSWDVHFENVANEQTTGGATVTTNPNIDSQTTTVNYTVTLNQPGDKYTFTVDVVNDGSIAARLHSFELSGVSPEQEAYINYTVTGMTQDQVLNGSEQATLTVTVEYDPNVSADVLPTSDQTLNLNATLNFVQDGQ